MSARRALSRSMGFTALATLLGLPLAGVVAWSAAGGPDWAGLLATVAYMGTPLSAAVVWNRVEGAPWSARIAPRFGRTWWWTAAWWLPVLIAVAALGASVALPGVRFDAGMSGVLDMVDPSLRPTVEAQLSELPPLYVLLPLLLVQSLVAGTTINALAAYGEEAGWRGWMHEELAPLGFWPRALTTGVLWGLWHAPLILQGHNYPEHPVLGLVLMVGMCVGLSAPMAELRDRTESVLSAAVFHGTFNAVASFPLLFVVGGDDRTVGVTGLAGLVVLLLVNGALALARAQKASSSSSRDHDAPIDTTATKNATSS